MALCAFVVACSGVDPLSCFDEESGASPENNICPGSYPLKYDSIETPAECAAQCLSDVDCKQFVMKADDKSGCRVSHICTTPSKAESVWNGYTRKTTAACQGGHLSHLRPTHHPHHPHSLPTRGIPDCVWNASVSASSTPTTPPQHPRGPMVRGRVVSKINAWNNDWGVCLLGFNDWV